MMEVWQYESLTSGKSVVRFVQNPSLLPWLRAFDITVDSLEHAYAVRSVGSRKQLRRHSAECTDVGEPTAICSCGGRVLDVESDITLWGVSERVPITSEILEVAHEVIEKSEEGETASDKK